MRTLLLLVALALAPAATGEEGRSRWAAAGWCLLQSGERPSGAASEEARGSDPGCDIGPGFEVAGWDLRQGRVSLVGALGIWSLGPGFAWTFGGDAQNPMSVGLLAAVPYDQGGIYVKEWGPALAITLTLGRRR